MKCISQHLLFFILLNTSCNPDKSGTSASTDNRTPATDTTIIRTTLEEYTEMNANSLFLQKSYIKSNATGYLQRVNVGMGTFVPKGKLLFTVKTKESVSLGNSINKLDTSFGFSGIVQIYSNNAGYITKLDHQPGDYIQDGEELAVISDLNSFVFLLNLPYELGNLAAQNPTLELTLPDGTVLQGVLSEAMPNVDPISQTQSYIIKVPARELPENLIAKVKLVKKAKQNAWALPKQAVLTDELQRSFWVMKMIDSVTAVKVLIQKGIETSDMVEIVAPKFSASDRILMTGNFGLPDTAKVAIQN